MMIPNRTDDPIQVSLILPVYNVADYLPECLDSIVAQSAPLALEALLVDDCSTDHSRSICQAYCERFPRLFRLMPGEANQGVSVARNRGLEAARGDYFMFIDPDDLLPADALQNLYRSAIEHDADIVKGNNSIFDEDGERQAGYNVRSETLLRGDEVLTTLFRHSRVRGHPWGKLFNRSRLGQVRFPVGVRMAQDLYYCGEVFGVARSLLLIDKPVYRYRLRKSGSTGRKYETGAYRDWLGSVEGIGAFAVNAAQRAAHRGLQLRTLAQVARECRKIDPLLAASVLETIEQKKRNWKIGPRSALRSGIVDAHALGHYLKLKLALRQLRQRLAEATP